MAEEIKGNLGLWLNRNGSLDIRQFRGRIVIPKRPRDAVRVQAMVDWVVAHYGRGFEFPKISARGR